MPELPEVETVRRLLSRVLVGHIITEAEVPKDDIVLGNHSPETIRNRFVGQKVTGVGRHGKFFWFEFADHPWVFAHLGMAGWIREIGAPTIRLREHGNAPFEDDHGRPRFLKLALATDQNQKIAFTDGRRLARIWLGESPASDKQISRLGPDVFLSPPTPAGLASTLRDRKAPIKALLLDQSLFAGVGNWIADEVLYHAGIAPARLGGTLSVDEIAKLCETLRFVVETAVEVGADAEKYPENWLFSARWGGSKGAEIIDGSRIVRETIGGRTTAWVPDRQS